MSKTDKKKKSYALTAMACALFFAAAGILMIMDKVLLQKSFFALSVIVLEAALVEIVIFFAVLSYEKKPAHIIRGGVLLICGAVFTIVYFTDPSLMPVCIGALICLEAVTDFKDIFSLKSTDSVWKCILIIDILIFLLGGAVIIFTFMLRNPLICAGVFTCICAILRFVTAFLRPFAKKAARVSSAPDESTESAENIQPSEPIEAEIIETVSAAE